MSNKKPVLNSDFLEIILILAKSWKLIIFGPLLCMAITAAFIYAQPQTFPIALAKVVAEPQQITLLIEPSSIRNLLATDANIQPSAADMADSASLRVIPEAEQLYRLELQNSRSERAIELLSALVEGLVRETTVEPSTEPSRRDITIEKLELALATVDRDSEGNDPVITALVDALSYILTAPSLAPTETSVSSSTVLVTEVPHIPPLPDARRHILITLFVGFASTAVLITLALIWSWAGKIMAKPENAETVRAIRAALPRFRGPHGS